MTATPMTAPTAPVMQAESLTRHYGVSQGFMKPKVTVKALVDVSFTLTAGQTLAVVGESGCGKSTLARQLTLIEPPTGGRLQVGDEWVTPGDRAQYKRLRSQVQMVFQNPYASLNPRQKIGHQIGEPLLLNTTLSAAERKDKVLASLKRVGLRPEHYDRYAHMFSGGQRQRIAIARAMVLQPKILVADEPTSALDVSVKAQIINLLLDLQQEMGLSILFISHDLSVVRSLTDRVAVMFQGRIVEEAPTETIFNDARHPYTRSLLDAIPVLNPRDRRARTFPSRAQIEAAIPRLTGFGNSKGLPELTRIAPDHRVEAILE